MSVDYDDNGDAIRYCRECGDPTEGDPFLCWGCDPVVIAKQLGVHVEWGYSEDERGRPRGWRSSGKFPDAEQWATAEAAKWRTQGGRVFARAQGEVEWVVIRDEW